MYLIGLEEHYISQQFKADYPAAGSPGHDAPIDVLTDVGVARIAAMDEAGFDFQVLGHGMYPADTASAAAVAAANDEAGAAVRANPTRFAGFAALPLSSAATAAAELRRTVAVHGFKGAMINGLVRGKFLDDPEFDTLFATAADLGVPFYLHPSYPVKAVNDVYYTGPFSPLVAFTLGSTAGGWHYEVGLHVLRLIVSGVFDRYPNMQIVIGHNGEGLPFWWERIGTWLEPRVDNLKLPVRDYLARNVYITTSGYTTNPPFELALRTFGEDRILYSVDYPFSALAPSVAFINNLPVADSVKRKIAHGNAAKLLDLTVP